MNAAIKFVLSQPWAMLPEMVDVLVGIADRTNDAPEAVAAKLGRPLDNTRTVEMRDNVAVIPVRGPISRYASMFDDISGATSVEILARDFQSALENPEVAGIVLEIDSPGGQAAGIGELAAQIRAGSKVKPVTCYVSNMGASAALWLASAGSRVVCAPQALMGSMGVVWPVSLPRKDEKGPRTIEFVSSQSPNKRPDPETDAGKAQMQSIVDAMASVFVESVAGYRKIDPKEAISRFGKGGVLVGRACVDAGMADSLGTLESCISDMAEKARKRSAPAKNHLYSQENQGHTMKFPFSQLFTGWMSRGCPETIDTADVAAIASEGEIIPENPETSEELDVASMGELTVDLKANTADLDAAIADAREKMRAEMAAELRAGRVALYNDQAEAFLTLLGGKVVPAERDNLKRAFVAAALIDSESPVEGFSALSGFKAGIEARKPHGAGSDKIHGDAADVAKYLSANGLKTLGNSYAAEPNADDDAVVAKMLAATDAGRAILAAQSK